MTIARSLESAVVPQHLFRLASLEHHSLELVFHLAVHPSYFLCLLWFLSKEIFFPFLTAGLKGSQYCSYLWLGFFPLSLSSYNAVLPPVQTSEVVSSLSLRSQEEKKEGFFSFHYSLFPFKGIRIGVPLFHLAITEMQLYANQLCNLQVQIKKGHGPFCINPACQCDPSRLRLQSIKPLSVTFILLTEVYLLGLNFDFCQLHPLYRTFPMLENIRKICISTYLL